MKALKFCLAVVIILIGSWLGASWYAGKTLEARLANYEIKYNAYIKDIKNATPFVNLIGNSWDIDSITLKLHMVKRGILSSVISGELNIAGENINLVFDVEHGPFPLPLLRQGMIQPKLAYMKLQIPKNSLLINLISAYSESKDMQTPFIVATVIDYDNKLTNQITVEPLKIKKAYDEYSEIILNTHAINGHIDIAPNNDYSTQINIDNFDFQLNGNQGYLGIAQLKLDGYSARIRKLTQDNFATYNGEQSFARYYSNIGIDDLLLEDVASDFFSQQEQKTPLSSLLGSLTIKNVQYKNVKLFAAKIRGKIEHIELDTLLALNAETEPGAKRQQLWLDLVAHEPVFSIPEFELTNEKGKITFDGAMQLSKYSQNDWKGLDYFDRPERIIKQINVRFSADIAALTHLFQFLLDNKEITDWIDGMVAQHLFVKNGNTIHIEFNYVTPDKFVINGQQMTGQELTNALERVDALEYPEEEVNTSDSSSNSLKDEMKINVKK